MLLNYFLAKLKSAIFFYFSNWGENKKKFFSWKIGVLGALEVPIFGLRQKHSILAQGGSRPNRERSLKFSYGVCESPKCSQITL